MILTGKLQPDTLKELNEFKPFYSEYQTDNTILEPMRKLSQAVNIIVIIGTWCSDCHREVARFIRIIETLKLNNKHNIHVTYLGVDRLKQDPEKRAQHYTFTQIPTFIIKQDGQELGRIVESPTDSLEVDLVNMLNR
ncbi:thioredoxin family protein [Shewanella surugensis]|uniref:Thioredoxin family protein n=1 Tax=Shewanella surugensis TaxID=212020 RepID=A0ABT0LF50_9GAMM|nr:thioredoxin family protein [Shewanella surugensis]MCL1126316.1 thioredoxin family protein [Shewanella surugensis]